MRVQGGFSTRERETTELTGSDYYKNMKQRKREEKALKEVDGIGRPKQQPGAAEGEQDGETDTDTTNTDTTNADGGEET